MSQIDAFCTSGNSPGLVAHGTPDAPPVLVLGGISATPDLGWWDAVIGPDKALDPARHRLLSAPFLERADISTADQAQHLLDLLDGAGVRQLRAVVGCSYGGMVALALAERAPERVGHLVVIGAAHRPHPLATAWRWVQRQLAHDPRGLALARALAMTTYRSDRELDERFGGDQAALVDWLEHHGARFVERFTCPRFQALSAAIDRHRVDPRRVTAPTTVVHFDTDQLAPTWLVDELVAQLPNATAVQIASIYGHDAFLKEIAPIEAVLREVLEPLEVPAPLAEDRAPLATVAVRTGLERDAQHGAVVPPLHLSSNYTFRGLGQPRQFDYTRSGNPTRALLAETLATLEGGAHAVVTASGMAAITTVLQLLEPGDRVVLPHDCYGGTWRLVEACRARGRFEVEWADLTHPITRRAALAKPTKLVWVETPSNPLLRVTDLAAIRALAPDAILVVDNTFLSPALQQPFAFGADVVVHSTTKYLNGHSDVVGGVVIAREQALGERLGWWANCLGVTGAPFDAWLTLRGVRTLEARMAAHQRNAEAIVGLLVDHPAVAKVHWPGLKSHPGHAIAARQQRGFGAMISFELAPCLGGVARFVDRLQHFSLAESLGGVESLVAHPASMTHASMSAEARARAGIGDALIRLSVGIEAAEDLCADLAGALDALAQPLAVGGIA